MSLHLLIDGKHVAHCPQQLPRLLVSMSLHLLIDGKFDRKKPHHLQPARLNVSPSFDRWKAKNLGR